jgi:Gamma-glutamyl cyclotransferase, AIG2-like
VLRLKSNSLGKSDPNHLNQQNMRPQMKKRLYAGVATVIDGLAPLAIGANTFVAYLLIWSFALSAQLAAGQTLESSPPSVMPAPLNDTSESLPTAQSPPHSALSLMPESDKDKSSAAAETPESSPALATQVMPTNRSEGLAPAQIPGLSLPSPTPLTPAERHDEPAALATPPVARLPENHSPLETKSSDGIDAKAVPSQDSQPASPSTSASPQVLGPKDASQNLAAQRSASLGRLGQAIVEFHKRSEGVVIFIVDLLALCVVVGLLSLAASTLGNYLWYPASLLAVFLYGWLQGNVDYFWVFALGMCTAFAEIIGKFRDEPLQSVRTGYAILYHIFNGIIAIFALFVLEILAGPPSDAGQHLRNVLAAGLGAMLIMRSKLFNIKMGGEDVSFGPEYIVKIFLSYMEGEIDRIRSVERIELVNRHVAVLQHDRFHELAEHILVMMGATARSSQQHVAFEATLKHIRSADGPVDARGKCCAICFELLNAMGEDFVSKVIHNAPPTVRNVAPSSGPTVFQRIAVAANPFVAPPREDLQYYMAYGAGMSGVRFRERLKWSEEKYNRIPAVKRCELPKYRLVFDKLDDMGTGRANVVPDETEKVEGVLYTLTKEQMHFLDTQMPQCVRRTMRVKTDGKFVDAEVYLALHTSESLRPNTNAVHDMINGAQERKLPPKYIEKLRELAAISVTPALPVRR